MVNNTILHTDELNYWETGRKKPPSPLIFKVLLLVTWFPKTASSNQGNEGRRTGSINSTNESGNTGLIVITLQGSFVLFGYFVYVRVYIHIYIYTFREDERDLNRDQIWLSWMELSRKNISRDFARERENRLDLVESNSSEICRV